MFNEVSLLNISKTPGFARMVVEIRQVEFVFLQNECGIRYLTNFM